MKLTNNDVFKVSETLARELREKDSRLAITVYPIPRGGIPAVYALLLAMPNLVLVENPEDADYIFDDIVDSGSTLEQYSKYGKPFLALYMRQGCEHPGELIYGAVALQGVYITFPWEVSNTTSSDEDLIVRILQKIGENPNREGLLETPKRVLKAYETWFGGYKIDPASVMKTFEDGAEKCDDIVIVKNIDIFSHCEHHMAPIIGKAHIGYLPDRKIIGISKLARLADIFARRLQVQERLTNQIADTIEQYLKPRGVAVVIEAQHTCMTSRGVKQVGTSTVTSSMRGCFRDEAEARSEFLKLIGY